MPRARCGQRLLSVATFAQDYPEQVGDHRLNGAEHRG
jgi:hypothetical protein